MARDYAGEALIHDERLTQSDAAELLGIQQSRVSDLVRGKIDRFSIDCSGHVALPNQYEWYTIIFVMEGCMG